MTATKKPNKHKPASPFYVGARVQARSGESPLGTLTMKVIGFKQWMVQWDDALVPMAEWEYELMVVSTPKRGKKTK